MHIQYDKVIDRTENVKEIPFRDIKHVHLPDVNMR